MDHERARVKDLEDKHAQYLVTQLFSWSTCTVITICLQLSTEDEKRNWGEDKVKLLQAQAKAEAAESSTRQEYNELRSEKVYCLVTIVSAVLTSIYPRR